jgi:outer membrane usher protein
VLCSISHLALLGSAGACQSTDEDLKFEFARYVAISSPELTSQESPEQAPGGGPVAPPQTSAFDINLPALIDNRYLGDIGVRIEGATVTIDVERLATILAPEITSDVLLELRSRGVNGRATPEAASTPNLQIVYNPQLQQVEIVTPSSARQLREIRYGFDPGSAAPGRLEQVAPFSAFISPTLNGNYVWESTGANPTGFEGLGGSVDIGGRVGGEKGVAFVSRHGFSLQGSPVFSRNESFAVYDDVRRLLRLTAGDLVPRGSSFQSIPRMAGVSLERFFGLEPDRQFRPVGNSSFQLDRPSTIEVRINGVTQREIFLRPGRYNLRDLPLVQGSNLVDLVIRDDRGQERIISDQNFFDFDLLAPGITDFSVAFGVRSETATRGPKYSDRPVATAFARHGLSQTLTAGIDVQADKEGVNGGVSLLWSSPVGVFQIDASGSQRKTFDSGLAAALDYKLTGSFGKQRIRYSLNLRGEYRSRNFSTIEDERPAIGPVLNQPTSMFFNARGQIYLGGLSFNGSGSYSKGRGSRADTKSALLGASYRVSSRLTVGGFARYTDDGTSKDTGFILQLFYRPSLQTDVRARYDTSAREAQVSYRKSAPNSVGSFSYAFDATRSQRDDRMLVGGDVSYIGNRFEADARHNVFSDSGFSSANRTQSTQVSIGSSLVFAGGSLAIARPVRESFAIVKPHPSLRGKEIRLDETERGYTARSDSLGPAVHVELSNYSRRSVSYSVDDLPLGYDLGTGEFTIRPPLNAGYSLVVGSGASFSLIGRALTKSGAPVPFVSGEIFSIDRPSDAPVLTFTNRNGRIAATGLRPGKYRLKLNSTPEAVREFTVEDGRDPLIDIGTIEVNTP